ncbi:MAG: hypothetical protein IT356_05810 [Gemmatimonadaceae bacterium]|nr:hypothetical protein [Gemmatimonadaceae bacterium]
MRSASALLAIAAASPLAASRLAAQGGNASAIAGPQYVEYRLGSGAAQKTVTQLSIPVAVIVPVSERLSLDLSAAWADSRVSGGQTANSSINGLTDTQLRANLSIFDGTAVLTLGVNAPTGKYRVAAGQQEAAGQIGSNFLLYPVSSMGSGGALTGGIALARNIADWNVTFGGSFRYSSPFDAFEVQNQVLRFEPGSEGRLRLGLDRAFGDNRFSVAVTQSAFADDHVKGTPDSTTIASGARTLAQGSLFMPRDWGDITISGWNFYRATGRQIGAVAPWENIGDVNLAVGFQVGSVYVQPSGELRAWMRDGDRAGALGTGGVRLRFDALGLSVNPSVTYSVGNLYPSIAGSASVDLTGLRATLLLRLR